MSILSIEIPKDLGDRLVAAFERIAFTLERGLTIAEVHLPTPAMDKAWKAIVSKGDHEIIPATVSDIDENMEEKLEFAAERFRARTGDRPSYQEMYEELEELQEDESFVEYFKGI
ncbi:MAG: hypothetical protein ACXABY_09455 [Candidatus Thorarchaeota archaeon]|jgi:hypothetical protein